MVNELLVELVNSVLGKGKNRARGNKAYICPFHSQEVVSPKLEVCFDENAVNSKGESMYQHWACWSCPKENQSKGKSIKSLFKKLDVSNEIMEQLKVVSPKSFGNRGITITHVNKELKLPKEFTKFGTNPLNPTEKRALNHLKKRGLTQEDIDKYNIGYCEYGSYSNRIIIPSYDSEGKLNYFTGRSFEFEPSKKYLNPSTSTDVIIFDLLINWNSPIILCEGMFDAIAIKRNAIPIMGKNIQPSLMKKLIQSSTKKIYVALDKDAIDYTLSYCETFLNEGKKVYLIELEDKDPSKLGFRHFTHLIQHAQPLTQRDLLMKKFEMA